jgi:copper chaperone CopZ
MRILGAGVLLGVCIGLGGSVAYAGGVDQKVTLMLGGKFCEAYPGDVSETLKKVPGVKEVDLKSMKGHAVVTVDAGKVKPEHLATAVNGVKGDGWHCTAQVMK